MTTIGVCLVPVAGDDTIVLVVGIVFAVAGSTFVTFCALAMGKLRFDEVGVHLGKAATDVIAWEDVERCGATTGSFAPGSRRMLSLGATKGSLGSIAQRSAWRRWAPIPT